MRKDMILQRLKLALGHCNACDRGLVTIEQVSWLMSNDWGTRGVSGGSHGRGTHPWCLPRSKHWRTPAGLLCSGSEKAARQAVRSQTTVDPRVHGRPP